MRNTVLESLLWSIGCMALLACGGGGGGTDNDGINNTTGNARFYPGNTAVPVTGPEVAGAARFDLVMTQALKANDVPGATLAIAKNGQLIFARGYGYADFEARQLMQPDAMMRIASVSKVLTSMATLHLKDQGLLDLDAKVLEILNDYPLPASADVRLRDITVRHLLQHAGGWDRSIAADPSREEFMRVTGASLPFTTDDMIRYWLTRSLNFAPGTSWHYSNLGYCMLGPVIEKASGQSYEHYVRDQVLLPMDVHAMSVGKSGLAGRGPYEVKYYEWDGRPLTDSEFPGQGKMQPAYGANMALCPSAGSWIASAIDLTRVMTAIDGSRGAGYLSADTQGEYVADPMLPPRPPGGWWGLGIAVGPTPDAWSHGGLGSTVAVLQRTSQYTFAFITNSWPPDADAFANTIHAGITRELQSAFEGSATDLYARFPSPNLPPSSP